MSEEDAAIQSLPSDLLNRIAPPISWDDAVAELTNTLDEWVQGRLGNSPVRVLVGPPGGGSYEIAHQWAERMGWAEISMPTIAQIFNGGDYWVDQLLGVKGSPRVLLRLERSYFRHHEGLKLVRSLKESLERGRSPCLIQCDSWGWAYLNNVLDLTSSLPEPLVLQSLGPDALRRLFRDIGVSQPPHRVLEMGSDKVVLSFETNGQQESGNGNDDAAASNFFDYLAWHSRGILKVAWNIWRYGLKVSEEYAGARDIRVQTWPGIGLPVVKSNVSQCESFLFHVLLLHGGLNPEVISQLIPFSSYEILQSLHQLRSVGLVEECDGQWGVTPLGYPSVRQHLSSEGYLVDAF